MRITQQEISLIPLMEYAKFEAKEDHTLVTITTDNDVVCKMKLQDIINKDCIVGQASLKALRVLGECDVNVDSTFNIASKKGKYKGKLVNDHQIIEFKIEKTSEVFVNNLDLVKAIKFAKDIKKTSTNEPPVLTGINIDNDSIVATDSFKLYTKKYDENFNINKVSAILHPVFVNFVTKYNFDKININNHQVVVITKEGLMIVGKLIAGNYPDTSKLISLQQSVKMNFKTSEVSEYINTALNVSTASEIDSSRHIVTTFECKDNNLCIMTEDYKKEDILKANHDFEISFLEENLKTFAQFSKADIYYQSATRPLILQTEQEIILLLPVRRKEE